MAKIPATEFKAKCLELMGRGFRAAGDLCDHQTWQARGEAAAPRPQLNGISDPFDRLIAATAIVERMPLVTADVGIQSSGIVKIIW